MQRHRAAFELQLDKPPERPLPTDEFSAREVLVSHARTSFRQELIRQIIYRTANVHSDSWRYLTGRAFEDPPFHLQRSYKQYPRSMFDLHGRNQRMVSPEIIQGLPDWLLDHPSVQCSSDGMLVASVPHNETITQILYGSNTATFDVLTATQIANDMQADLKAWQKEWLADRRTYRWDAWKIASIG